LRDAIPSVSRRKDRSLAVGARARPAHPGGSVGCASDYPTQHASPPELPKVRVLLVEDDRAVAQSTTRLLEREGFRVECAFDGEAALELARTHVYAVIVLDRRLPRLSGDEVLRRLSDDNNPTPVLMLTGYPDVASAFEAGQLSAAGYLQKALVSGTQLAAAIRKAARPAEPSARVSSVLFRVPVGYRSECFIGLAQLIAGDPTVTPTALAALLASAISHPDLTFVEFMAAARSLELLHRQAHLPAAFVLPRVRTWIEEAAGSTSIDPDLDAMLARIEAAGTGWTKVTEPEAGRGFTSAGGARYLTRSLDATFHQCRRAIVMRRAVLALLNRQEHVRQVAYRLGYSDHANFDHDFRGFFGIAPTTYRRLL
jgi:DNA-binding response OmpR family regulator